MMHPIYGATGLRTAERRVLASTALHAITSLHGEAGLQERFAVEIEGLPAAGRARAERALEVAGRLHAAGHAAAVGAMAVARSPRPRRSARPG